jgi:PAS domain S-box-containing protein
MYGIPKQPNRKGIILSITLYILGGLVSLLLFETNNNPYTLWLPLGVALGAILLWSPSVLPGIALASLACHIIIYGFYLNGSVKLTHVTMAAITSVVELAMVFGVYKILIWYRTFRLSTGKLQRITPVSVSYLFAAPLFAALYIALASINGLSFDKMLLVNTALGNLIVLFLIPPIFITSIKAFPIDTNRYKILLLIITSIGIGLLPIFTAFNHFGVELYYALIFIFIALVSSSQNFRVFIIAQALLFLVGTYSLLVSEFLVSANMLANHLILSSVAILLSYYFNIKFDLRVAQLNKQLAKPFEISEDTDRKTEEYRRLTEELFIEVDKRAKAEKELAQSKRLLTEAQEYSGIATWEYSISKKQFRWISYNKDKPILGFDIEKETLSTFAKRLHPDDFYALSKLNRGNAKDSMDFEMEIRIKNDANIYEYFLLRGRNLSDNKKSVRVVGLIMDITERKKFEQLLLEKEQKYRALFDSNIDPVCVIHANNYQIKDVNPAFERVYGFARNEIIGKPYISLSAEPDETKATIAFGRQKGHYRIPHRVHLKKNGEKFFIEANLMSYMVNGEEMLFIITHDISERKKAENLLAEREQKFRAYFESDLIGMAEISIAKEFQNLNNKLVRMLGYKSKKEVMLMTWDDVTHPDDRAQENRLFNEVITHISTGYSIEKRFLAKDGTYVYCSVYIKSIKNTQGNITHLIVLIDDISNRKRAEIELQESKAQLSQAQAVAKLGSIRLQPGNNSIKVSDEAYEIMGYGNGRPPLTRSDLLKMILPGSSSKLNAFISTLEEGKPIKGDHEIEISCTNGEVKYLLINFGLTLNTSKQVKEILITLADITRIKSAEMALQEANALKDQLFSIIGHDLRSPISSINQLIEILHTHWNEWDSETINSTLETLKSSSAETYKLLENLLEWANSQRLDKFKPVQTDLIPILEDVFALTKGTASSKNISIQKKLLQNAPVFVDVEMIKTVLRNLIGNSIKFTPSGGNITIDLKENSNTYLVSIKDNGVGITEKDQLLLFDNASSISTPGTNNERGTGLGLKLVKKFIDKNSGEIFVKSKPGEGSQFSFTLPKANQR